MIPPSHYDCNFQEIPSILISIPYFFANCKNQNEKIDAANPRIFQLPAVKRNQGSKKRDVTIFFKSFRLFFTGYFTSALFHLNIKMHRALSLKNALSRVSTQNSLRRLASPAQTAYRCYLPVLARFTAQRRARPEVNTLSKTESYLRHPCNRHSTRPCVPVIGCRKLPV